MRLLESIAAGQTEVAVKLSAAPAAIIRTNGGAVCAAHATVITDRTPDTESDNHRSSRNPSRHETICIFGDHFTEFIVGFISAALIS